MPRFEITVKRVVEVETVVVDFTYSYEAGAMCERITDASRIFDSVGGEGHELVASYKELPDLTPAEAVCDAAATIAKRDGKRDGMKAGI